MGKQKYTIDSVRSFLLENDLKHECDLLSTEYINTKTKLNFHCNICGEDFERNFEALKVSVNYCCGKCSKKKSGGIRTQGNIQEIKQFLKDNDIENQCTLLSTKYINSQSPLRFKCNLCGKEFERNFQKLKLGRFKCPECGQQTGAASRVYSQEEVAKMIYEQNQYVIIGEFQGSHNPVLCKCNRGHEFNLYFSEWKFRGRGCPKCAIINRSGKNHWNYQNGGHQEVMDMLRHKIVTWKKDCLIQHNFQCDITQEKNALVVHHLKNFTDIVKEASDNTGIPILNKVSDYAYGEQEKLSNEVIRLHTIDLGVPIQRKLHDEFHLRYGKKNNTKEQYEEFKKNILNEK